MTTNRKRRSGVVLALVLVLALILSMAVLSFERRALIDWTIVHNREKVAQSEALARAGVEIAKAVLVEQFQRKMDALQDRAEGEEIAGNTLDDLWARVGDHDLVTPEGAIVRISLFDNRSRLNLNSLISYSPPKAKKKQGDAPNSQRRGPQEGLIRRMSEQYDAIRSPESQGEEQPEARTGKPLRDAEDFLTDFLDRVIENMPAGQEADEEQKEYETRELARSLLDYMDTDDVGIDGGDEEDYYASQDPPYLPANRPMLSIEELGLVEGFDPPLVEAIRPYVTVYPLVRGRGVNINTAPPHVIGALYHGVGGSRQLLSEDDVVQVLDALEEGNIFCEATEINPDKCITLAEANLEGEIFPPTELPAISFTYTVVAEVQFGDIERSVEAVLTITEPGKPRLLFWRME